MKGLCPRPLDDGDGFQNVKGALRTPLILSLVELAGARRKRSTASLPRAPGQGSPGWLAHQGWFREPSLRNLQILGGASRDRTGDLLHAMQALSQLSYSPTAGRELYDPDAFSGKPARVQHV